MGDFHTQPDIVERLRNWPATAPRKDAFSSHFVGALLNEAADRIEDLQAKSWKYLQEVGTQARQVEELTKALEWQPIHTAPEGKDVLLFSKAGQYIGRARHGAMGEPQSHHFGFRAYCCGRFADPTHWKPLPQGPAMPLERSGGAT